MMPLEAQESKQIDLLLFTYLLTSQQIKGNNVMRYNTTQHDT